MSSIVQSGCYDDYGYDNWQRRRWVVSAHDGAILNTFIGVITVIGLSRLMRIVLKVYDNFRHDPKNPNKPGSVDGRGWSEFKYGFGQLSEGAVRLETEQTTNDLAIGQQDSMEIPPRRSRSWSQILQSIPNAFKNFVLRIIRSIARWWSRVWNFVKDNCRLAWKNFRSTAWKPLLAGILLLLSWVVIQVLGVTSGLLRGGTLALASSFDSGFYVPNATTRAELLRVTTPLERNIQTESAALARDCFDKNTASPGSCSSFLDASIDVEISNTTCPFGGDMCALGAQPIRFSTVFNSRKLGINARNTVEVNRTTICSPLNMNATFIRIVASTPTNTTYGYFYGTSTVSANNRTFESYRRDGSIGDAAGYNVEALWNHQAQPVAEWQPIEQLRPTFGSSVTLLIVMSGKTFYDNPRDDPIFPAHEPRWLPISQEQLWVNGPAGPGTVMACKDWNYWRDPRVPERWYTSLQTPLIISNNSLDQAGSFVTVQALHSSTIHSTISRRLESALDAQRKMASSRSLLLADPQWPAEAEQLFKASIARMFIVVRNVAFGTGKLYPGYVKAELTVDGNPLSFRGFYLFNADGWADFDRRGFLVVVSIAVMSFILAISWKDDKLTIELLLQAICRIVCCRSRE